MWEPWHLKSYGASRPVTGVALSFNSIPYVLPSTPEARFDILEVVEKKRIY
jgi:hypothetical protein